jgi:hypothetical protein
MKDTLPAAQTIDMAPVKKPAVIFFKAEKFKPMYLKKGYIYARVNKENRRSQQQNDVR